MAEEIKQLPQVIDMKEEFQQKVKLLFIIKMLLKLR
jgi:hypothetical protein